MSEGPRVVVPPDLLALIPPAYRAAALVGDSPSEIERWRAERRRHFPTDAVVSAKRARAEEGHSRGEVPAVVPLGKLRRGGRDGAGVVCRRERGILWDHS